MDSVSLRKKDNNNLLTAALFVTINHFIRQTQKINRQIYKQRGVNQLFVKDGWHRRDKNWL